MLQIYIFHSCFFLKTSLTHLIFVHLVLFRYNIPSSMSPWCVNTWTSPLLQPGAAFSCPRLYFFFCCDVNSPSCTGLFGISQPWVLYCLPKDTLPARSYLTVFALNLLWTFFLVCYQTTAVQSSAGLFHLNSLQSDFSHLEALFEPNFDFRGQELSFGTCCICQVHYSSSS